MKCHTVSIHTGQLIFIQRVEHTLLIWRLLLVAFEEGEGNANLVRPEFFEISPCADWLKTATDFIFTLSSVFVYAGCNVPGTIDIVVSTMFNRFESSFLRPVLCVQFMRPVLCVQFYASSFLCSVFVPDELLLNWLELNVLNRIAIVLHTNKITLLFNSLVKISQKSGLGWKYLKDNKYNGLHLASKICMYSIGHYMYLFLKVHSFPQALLLENCLFLKTDNDSTDK